MITPEEAQTLRGSLARDASRAFAVSAAAAEHAERVALVDAGEVWTYGRLAKHVAGVARWLEHRSGGISYSKNRAVAIIGERRLESLLVAYATFELGWTLVPLHARWSHAEKSRLLRDLAGDLDFIANPEGKDSSGPWIEPSAISSQLRVLRAEPRWRGEVPADRPMAVVPTSGTTGHSKGVVLSYGAMLASARSSARRLGWHDDDRWLASLPLAHVGGLSIFTRCLSDRRTAVLTPEGERFDAQSVLTRLHEDRITHLSVVPLMLRRLLDIGAPPPPSLRRLLVGGAPLPPAWLAEARLNRWPALATYGLTEACSQVATQPPADLESPTPRPGAPLLDGYEARIDTRGVLSLRGPALCSGYLPRQPSPALDEEGWLRTGDVARFEDGRLHILGRHDHMIVTGGENVHPAEVERALLELPEIHSACVVGLPDATWGQVVAAAITPATVDPDSLKEKVLARVARFKRPKLWRIVESLPSTASGKVDRGAVERLFERS